MFGRIEKILSKFDRPVRENESPQEIFSKWRILKRKTRLSLCIASSIIFYLGLTQASPRYSLLDEIAKKHQTLAEEGRALNSAVIEIFFLLKYAGDTIEVGPKIIVVAVAFGLFWTVISFRDQFANDARLRRLRLSGPRRWRGLFSMSLFAPIRRDIEAYAQVLPSNRLQNICTKCDHFYGSACANKINDTDRFILNETYTLWNRISHTISPIALNEILKETFWCRLSFHCRLLSLLLGYFFLSIYLIHRSIEVLILDTPANPNLVLLFATAACFFFTWCLGYLFGTEISCESRWHRLSTKVSEALNDNTVAEAYQRAYSQLICTRGGSTRVFAQSSVSVDGCNEANFHALAVRLLDTLIDYLNRHVTTKLLYIAEGRSSQKSSQDEFVKRCIVQLEKFFEANFPNETFRAYIAKPSSGNFGTFSTGSAEEEFIRKISDGARRLGYFCKSKMECEEVGEFPEEYESLFVLPLEFSEDHQDDLKRGLHGNDRFTYKISSNQKSYVVISSTNKHRFASDHALTANLNFSLIYPFVHRAAFEKVRSEINNRRRGK